MTVDRLAPIIRDIGSALRYLVGRADHEPGCWVRAKSASDGRLKLSWRTTRAEGEELHEVGVSRGSRDLEQGELGNVLRGIPMELELVEQETIEEDGRRGVMLRLVRGQGALL